MKKAIVHISDLHVSLHQTFKGDKIDVFSHLTTNSNDGQIDNFINEFCIKIKKQFNEFELYLIISGDIANKGILEEFTSAKKIINSIISELGISKEKVLIVPGDHDINYDNCRLAHENGIRNGQTKQSFEYFTEKFENFSNFYNEFYDSTCFFPEKTIVNSLVIEQDKLLIVGLNSNYKIDYDGGNGYFEINNLRNELNELLSNYKDYSVVCVFHHNIFAAYDNTMTGQWDNSNSDSNRLAVFRLFEEFGVNTLLYGNEHTRCSFYNSNHKVTYSDSGTFANSKQNPISSFKVYEIISEDNKLYFKNNLFLLLKAGLTDLEFPFGTWTLQMQSESIGELEIIPMRTPEESEIKADLFLDDKGEKNEIATGIEVRKNFKNTPKNYIPFSSNDKDHLSLLKIIKSKNLFHSGHFHWSETSRAHNWIDVSKLLNNREDLLDAKKYILNLIDKNKIDFDFIIGLGIEGNMLATRTAIIKSKDYTFLPYSYRYDDHSDHEKQLNFENDGLIKKVLIITDVVHDGRTIRKLIHKKRPEDNTAKFFEHVEKIIVVSLFFTGELTDEKSDYHYLLNKSIDDENFDSDNDHEEDRIQFHFVSHLKVQECPYNKNNYKTDCIIVSEGLCGIHKFYTEKK